MKNSTWSSVASAVQARRGTAAPRADRTAAAICASSRRASSGSRCSAGRRGEIVERDRGVDLGRATMLRGLAVDRADRGAQHGLALRRARRRRAPSAATSSAPRRRCADGTLNTVRPGWSCSRNHSALLHQRQRRRRGARARRDALRRAASCAGVLALSSHAARPRHGRRARRPRAAARCARASRDSRAVSLRGQQRVAAEREEVVVHADAAAAPSASWYAAATASARSACAARPRRRCPRPPRPTAPAAPCDRSCRWR